MRNRSPMRRGQSCLMAAALLLLPAWAPAPEIGPPLPWGIVLYFVLVLLIVGAMLGLSYVLGERHAGKARDEPYESAVPVTGSGHVRFDVKFYAVALFFVIFDIETVFILAWAIAARALGWPAYIDMAVFVLILVAALVYLWRSGALAWGTSARLAAADENPKLGKE
ncbi:MAG: NADH-quinone oxidoreductase subunit A [Anaerolineae bacterium]